MLRDETEAMNTSRSLLSISVRRLAELSQKALGYLAVFAAGGLVATVSAQAPTKAERTRTSAGVSNTTVADPTTGIIRHRGAVYFVKEGHPQRVRGKLELSEGLTVQEDGQIIFRTRQSATLREGEFFHLNGDIRPIPPEIVTAVEALGSTKAKPN
jgi:hypothetical protein